MASTTAFITDIAVAADLFDRGLSQLEEAAKKKAEECRLRLQLGQRAYLQTASSPRSPRSCRSVAMPDQT